MEPPEVDVSVLVHENVSKARQTLQPLRGLERDHAAREQPGRDLAVLVDRLLELAGQDVAARVEEGLGGERFQRGRARRASVRSHRYACWILRRCAVST